MALDPRISEWDNPPHLCGIPALRGGERGELKHLSTPRRRKQISDSPSSGERTGNSPNPLRGNAPRGLQGHATARMTASATVWKVRP